MAALSPGTRMFDSSELEALWTYPGILTVTPLTGTTVTMPATQQFLYVTPAGTIAALTVRLPPNPQNGQGVAISFLQIVTTLTIQTSAGGAVATTAGAIGVGHIYRYVAGTWRRWS